MNAENDQQFHTGYTPNNLYPDSMDPGVPNYLNPAWVNKQLPPNVFRTGGTTTTSQVPALTPHESRLALYFGSGIFPSGEDATDPNFQPLMKPGQGVFTPGNWDDRPSPEVSNLYDLLNGAGGVRGALQRLVDLQWTDPEKVTAIQMELMLHGFYGDSDGQGVDLGRVDNLTSTAMMTMIQNRMKTMGGESFDDFMAHHRKNFNDAQFTSMEDKLKAFDESAAEGLESLRDQIEQMDLSITLSDPVGLEQDIQAQAVATIGRRLKDSEVQGLIGNIHGKEKEDYYANSPEYREYQKRVRMLQLASTTIEEDRAAVIAGDQPADLDQFMMAISAQESGGNPNALNADSGAFGKYQFMPATWAAEARLSGLNPNDKSEQNQDLMARHMASRYFNMFGSWYKVAQAWYAGPGSSAIQGGSVGNKSQGKYPTINSYAEQITERMLNGGQLEVDQAYAAADAGSLGGATQTEQGLGQEDLAAWWEGRQQASQDLVIDNGAGGLAADTNAWLNSSFDAPGVGTTTAFDMQAYMASQVEEAGGVDTDAFRFAQNAQTWYAALEAR